MVIDPMTILAALSPAARFAALRGSSTPTPLVSGTFWVPVVVAIVFGVTLICLYRRWYNQRQRVRLFVEAADRLGLTQEERLVLANVAAAAEVKRIETVFVLEETFDLGAERLVAKEGLSVDSRQGRTRLSEVLDSLRRKLGFAAQARTTRSAPASKVLLAGGDVVTIVRRGGAGHVQATVVTSMPGEIFVQTQVPVEFAIGEAWCVRRVRDGTQWECDTTVIDGMDQRVHLRLIGEARSVNLRRFSRVPTHRPAYVARFPFVAQPKGDALPQFVPGILSEMAGPGLRIDSRLETQVGDRVLVVVQLDADRVIQSIAVVRRAMGSSNGISVMVAEMTGLTDQETGELVCETNAAARRAGVDPEEDGGVLVGAASEVNHG